MHGLVTLFLEVIMLAIILFHIGLAVLKDLVIATRTIMVSIISMTIVGSLVVTIALVASMIVAVPVVTMLLVAQFTAVCDGKMSRLLLFWFLFVLGDLLKNTGRFVGRLTLPEKSNELKQVHGHHLVCVREL